MSNFKPIVYNRFDLFVFKAPEGAKKIDLLPAAKKTTTEQNPHDKTEPKDQGSK